MRRLLHGLGYSLLRNRGTLAGFSKWLAPFMAGAIRRANRRDLAALKRRLESPVHGGRAP